MKLRCVPRAPLGLPVVPGTKCWLCIRGIGRRKPTRSKENRRIIVRLDPPWQLRQRNRVFLFRKLGQIVVEEDGSGNFAVRVAENHEFHPGGAEGVHVGGQADGAVFVDKDDLE